MNIHNCFTGTLPAEIGNLHNMVFFGVERNQIGGSFPYSIFMNMSSLHELTLRRNKFTGNLSKDVGNLTMLTQLSISNNYMTGNLINCSCSHRGALEHILNRVLTYIQSRAATWHETCNTVNTKMQYIFVKMWMDFCKLHFSYRHIAFYIVKFFILT